ncbi:LemA family protein [Gallalistipes aquisgranensis]|uniref:LemA family protein n=1 Tax=Gallalistipes aquisgranensis TaxID=2779358 RepID=UPI001CF912D6|nr:LemA family protein [Gallalistipes aquisgranensis]MBE5033399.1 LemA family protein [Gallalistipes aquisgranensis]
MKKGTIILIVAAVVVVALFLWMKNTYNGMVNMREGVKAQWANVENQYQRRSDLIPNLVNTVKGYASHESSTLEAVTEARSKATQTQVNFDRLDEQTLQQYNRAQGEVSSVLSRLMAISESYPDLKANQNFRDLQVQLEGTENRISVERRKFNESAQSYNRYIMQFPRNLFASMFGFRETPYFSAQEGAEQAPKVEF